MGLSSLAGGAGSGLASKILQKVREEYSKSEKMWVPIFPESWVRASSLSAYNVVLANEVLREEADIIIPFSNHSLQRFSRSNYKKHSEIYQDYNNIISQVLSSIT